MFLLRRVLALVALLAFGSVVLASSAGFLISAKGIDLGKGEEVVEKEKDVVRYKVKAEVGKPFTLTAQGVVYPRGVVVGQPSAPESGAWEFDATAFKKSAPVGKPDETQVSVTLTPQAAGSSRIRFTGKILGYERTYDLLVETAAGR